MMLLSAHQIVPKTPIHPCQHHLLKIYIFILMAKKFQHLEQDSPNDLKICNNNNHPLKDTFQIGMYLIIEGNNLLSLPLLLNIWPLNDYWLNMSLSLHNGINSLPILYSLIHPLLIFMILLERSYQSTNYFLAQINILSVTFIPGRTAGKKIRAARAQYPIFTTTTTKRQVAFNTPPAKLARSTVLLLHI